MLSDLKKNGQNVLPSILVLLRMLNIKFPTHIFIAKTFLDHNNIELTLKLMMSLRQTKWQSVFIKFVPSLIAIALWDNRALPITCN